MGNIAIKAEGLSKLYEIRALKSRHDTLRDQVVHSLRSLMRRNMHGPTERGFWALKDVSFEVQQGEVLGIVGHNGAGKSTLLKILSRITEPTVGTASVYGRVSSLLEVGTGFHPELTGRENVYLNAAMLGMRKAEINRNFDRIVDFSGVEEFIDTPVKRYSSGMYVRLAFAVAAHLEPEILIVDEVLAVGDASFQQKCLGKMEDVSRSGRTVLIVSHNLPMIETLCTRALLLSKGKIIEQGDAKKVVETYASMNCDLSNIPLHERTDRVGRGEILVTAVGFLNRNMSPLESVMTGREVIIRLYYKSTVNKVFRRCRVSVSVNGKHDEDFFIMTTELVSPRPLDLSGTGWIDFTITELPLTGGMYYLQAAIESEGQCQDWIKYAAPFPVVDGDFYGSGRAHHDGWRGNGVLIKYGWSQGQSEHTS